MKFARALMIFSYGLFTIAAQTLLFREFITTFEGNDISVGIFFGSWLLWVGLAASVVYKTKTLAQKLLANIHFLFLAYLPAFVLQFILTVQARELAGMESYALPTVTTLLLLAVVVNAPISIITGMLFVAACRWFRQTDALPGDYMPHHKQHRHLPVSRVYILEAAGSFAAGVGTTVLLAVGVGAVRIFFILAFFVSFSALMVELAGAVRYKNVFRRKVRAGLLFLLPLGIIVGLAAGLDRTLTDRVKVLRWTKLFPRTALAGSFQTAQAQYLYGTYQQQWMVVREGGVCETLPPDTAAGQAAAICLSQKPQAANVLVIGNGLGLCYRFLRLPQIRHVTWSHCDSEYIQVLETFVPPEFKLTDVRLHRLAGDIRDLLAERPRSYDIVILNLPETTSSVLNRYYTVEFYQQIKESLAPDGILGVRIQGGENIMGTELINLGASTAATLRQVFSRFVITAGEHTWFIASDGANLTPEPGTLRDRFAAIPGAEKVFSADGLLSVYLPDRAEKALADYSAADLPPALLINRDARPLTHLYSLLLAAKQSAAPVTRLAKRLARAGAVTFLVPILIFVVLRIVYMLTTGRGNTKSSFNSTYLVFSAGLAGIGTVICLCYLYQARFGWLYLHIGIISSLFMVGMTAGAITASNLLSSPHSILKKTIGASSRAGFGLLILFIIVNVSMLTAVAFWPQAVSAGFAQLLFAMTFILCGFCGGGYFPVAAHQLAESAFETGTAAGKLETADHIGSALGGMLTSVAMVPLFGTRATMLVLIALMSTNVPIAIVEVLRPSGICIKPALDFRLRRAGYVLFTAAAVLIVFSNILTIAGGEPVLALPRDAAQALVGAGRLNPASAMANDTGRKADYFEVYRTADTAEPDNAEKKLAGYVFSSSDFAPQVTGFGGGLNLAIYTDPNGALIDFHIIRSNETPSYLQLLDPWRDTLLARNLFQSAPFAGVDSVTGATISSQAVLSALELSANTFAGRALNRTFGPGPSVKTVRAAYLPDKNVVYLIAALLLTLIVIYRGSFYSRVAVLCFNLIAGGLVLNTQYSTDQVAALLSGNIPAVTLTAAFLLVVGMPFIAALFGNIYCGYICPFGAAQELVGYIVPARFKRNILSGQMQNARFVKYVLLFVLVVVFFVTRNRTILCADPLIAVFNFRLWLSLLNTAMPYLLAGVFIAALFYGRFWCRYLCPAGAFLSLFNKLALLKRYVPAKKFAFCEFGVTAEDHTDCIYCDRCRYQPAVPSAQKTAAGTPAVLSRFFIGAVIVAALFVFGMTARRFVSVRPFTLPAGAVSAAAGKSRGVDVQLIKDLIRQKRLSDHESQYYEKAK